MKINPLREVRKSKTERGNHLAQNRLLQPDGGLFVRLPPTEVTWYRFLTASRLANSTHGGWNFKSYWNKRAFDLLIDAPAIVKEWTQNSLTKDDFPEARAADFKLSRKFSESRDALLNSPSERSENQLNARLFKEYSTVSGKRFMNDIRFFGYEIPLSSKKSGMLRIDLLGQTENRGLALVELKKHDGSDTPLMAFTELVCYALQLIRCKSAFLPELKSVGVDWDERRPIRVVIAAQSSYWKKWRGDQEHDEGEWLECLSGRFKTIIREINSVLATHHEPTLTLELGASEL